MRTLLIVAALCACLLPGTAMADGVEPIFSSEGVSTDSRVRLLHYDDNDVYTINTRYGYQTSIVFGKNEEIQTISVGDRSLWQIIPSGHRLFIRPMDNGVITNMTVLTNKHSYLFDIKSDKSEKTGPILYVAKFVYLDDVKTTSPMLPYAASAADKAAMLRQINNTAQITSTTANAPAPLAANVHPINPNYNYTFSGPDQLAPLQVYDDGRSTYIKYPHDTQPLPNAYIVDSTGEHLTTHYIRDGVMVVDAVTGEMALKNSDGTVHIYNESLNPR